MSSFEKFVQTSKLSKVAFLNSILLTEKIGRKPTVLTVG